MVGWNRNSMSRRRLSRQNALQLDGDEIVGYVKLLKIESERKLYQKRIVLLQN